MKLIAENRIQLDEGITRREINALLKGQGLASEPYTILPQANDFNKVVEILGFMNGQPVTVNEVAMHQGFSRRQADYYLDALNYLFLVEKSAKGTYKPTEFGMMVHSMPAKQKCLQLAKRILVHPMFRRFFQDCACRELIGTRSDAIAMLKDNGYMVDDSATLQRRAGTIRCWIVWIYSLAWDVRMDYA
ncbi:MAG: FaeA/PapI family transcriptional regulator [Candidatus Enteromonas sp.]